ADVNTTCASETEISSEKPPAVTAAGPVLVNVKSSVLPVDGGFAVALPALRMRLAQSGGDAASGSASAPNRAYIRSFGTTLLLIIETPMSCRHPTPAARAVTAAACPAPRVPR